MDLVIMAAGMGSRFGGLKQIEKIDDNGNFIIDYSIYDAIKTGFDRVVFIIKEENFEIFKETVGNRISKKIKTEYVFQKGLDIKPDRTKPWGTAHAILSCKDVVKSNFAIINADDFYGYDAYKTVSDYLKNLDKNSTNFALVGYEAKNTLSENGAAKRGVCEATCGYLSSIVESSVEIKNGRVFATPLETENTREIAPNTIVSMNMFAFTPRIFGFLEKDFKTFLEENKNNYEKCEFLIPTVVDNLIKSKNGTFKVLPTTAVWQGVTYREDKEKLVLEISKLVKKGEYPKNLWN